MSSEVCTAISAVQNHVQHLSLTSALQYNDKQDVTEKSDTPANSVVMQFLLYTPIVFVQAGSCGFGMISTKFMKIALFLCVHSWV